MYDQSVAQLNKQRIENNAAIDVDAASRGMGNSSWVTDAKLRQLRGEADSIAALDANYNNQLYSALLQAIQDRDDKAYDQALYWWQKGKSGKKSESVPTLTTPDSTPVLSDPTAHYESVQGWHVPQQEAEHRTAGYVPSYAYKNSIGATTQKKTGQTGGTPWLRQAR